MKRESLRVVLVFVVLFGALYAFFIYASYNNSVGTCFLIDENGKRISRKSYISVTSLDFENTGMFSAEISNMFRHQYRDRHEELLNVNEKYLITRGYRFFANTRKDGYVEVLSNGWRLYDDEGPVFKLNNSDCDLIWYDENGLSVVEGNNHLYGYIDKDYNYVIEEQFSFCTRFYENGMAMVSTPDGQTGMINTKGEYVIPLSNKIQNIVLPFDTLVAIEDINGEYTFWNENGQRVFDETYDDASSFDGGLASVEKDGKYFVINIKGEIIAESEDPAFVCDGMAIVINKDGCRGVIDADGNTIIPYDYSSIGFIDENKNFIVGQNDLYGVLDRNGNVVVPIKYNDLFSEACGLRRVIGENNLHGYVNSEGEEVIKCQFEDAAGFEENGLARVKVDGLYGFIDTEGNWKIDPIYSGATGFNAKYGVAIVSLPKHR